jgi:hypothetical protein
MISLAIRFVLGWVALASVWFATWPFEVGSYSPLFAAAAVCFLLAAISSRAALTLKKTNRQYAAVFALPFVAPVVVSALALFDGISRPFLYWTMVSVVAVLLALAADLLVLRFFTPRENGPNKPV